MPPRSHETPFERRERLNLEAAIARSSSSVDMIGLIESGSTVPGAAPHPGPFIPNSQSDEESIQQFTTIANSSMSSIRLSPPNNNLLPVQSSSIDQSLVREPGWSLEKFHHSDLSNENQSSHLNSKSSHSSPQHRPQPIILAAASSESNPSSNSIPLVPPHLPSPAAKDAHKPLEPHHSNKSAANQHISQINDPPLQKRASSRVYPAEILQKNSDQSSVPEIQIIQADPPARTSNPQSTSGLEASDPQPKKKRKMKSQGETELGKELGSKESQLKVDQDGKRIRKQSAAGKASARSLEILSNLSQPANEVNVRGSKPKEQAINGSSKSQRRRVFRDGWVIVSDSDTEPSSNPRKERSPSIEDQTAAYTKPAPKEICPPPVVPPLVVPPPKDKPSQSSHEIISSPLSSPSGFSPDEKGSKSSKKPKTSAVKKTGPKKKSAAKPKTKKGRKGGSNSPAPPVNAPVSPLAADPINPPPAPNPINESEVAGLEVPCQVENNIITCQSPGRTLEAHKAVADKSITNNEHMNTSSKDKSKKQDGPQSGPVKSALQQDPSRGNSPINVAKREENHKDKPKKQDQPPPAPVKSALQPDTSKGNSTSDVGKGKSSTKISQKKNTKLTLAEILASTNPKTKRGLRIGLPKEEKHRLHININPKPMVQKQVKKKLKVRRGEYDSGEDDQPCKNGESDSDSEDDKATSTSKNLAKSKRSLSQEDVADDDDQDYRDERITLEDEEY